MAFYVYTLLCRDGSIYTGQTDNLELRVAQHHAGGYCRYTAMRRPLRLIFSDSFASRDEALTAERMLKGWRRSKKLALARGDWKLVRELAAIRSPDRRAAKERSRQS